MKKYVLIIASILLWAITVNGAMSYDVIKVRDGADLKGVVTFEGTVPREEVTVIKNDVEYCGKEYRSGAYQVADSKVRNVVVWIDGIEKGRALPDSPVEITIKNCRANPHVSVGFVGGEYVFRNDDEILHTVQSKLGLAYQKEVSRRPLKDGASIYNLALPKQGMEVRKPIKKWHRYSDETGYIQVMSNTHNWIRSYVFVFDHPYAAVTDANGSFELKDLPPGEYVLNAWHEGFGLRRMNISVSSGETEEVRIAFGD